MQPVRIGYHRLWPTLMFLLAGLNVGVVLVAGVRGPLPIAMAVLFGVAGLLYLTRPLLVVDDERISAKSLVGYTVSRVPHGGFKTLEVEPGGIVFGPPNDRARVRMSGWMVNRKHLDQLAAAVRAARAT